MELWTVYTLLVLVVFLSWIGLIAAQSTLNIDKDMISGVEKVFYVMVGALANSILPMLIKQNRKVRRK